jgi:hypothetical protein
MVLRERTLMLRAEFPRYGYRRVTQPLHAEGLAINREAGTRIMRENELQVWPLRRLVRTTERS